VRRGIEGVVVLEALLDRFGDVGRARVLKSVPMLDAAAIVSVLAWGYVPESMARRRPSFSP
jgi:TonB family protein